MKKVMLVLLCVAVCVGLVGCEKAPEDEIVGTWRAIQPIIPRSDETEIEEETAEFGKDGTVTITLKTTAGEIGEQEIEYSVENDKVTLDGAIEFEMRDDKLFFEDEVFFEKIK